MHWLFILFFIIPAIEIVVFIWISQLTNIWFILLMIILTGFFGVYLARKQGIITLKRARFALDIGQIPGREILDGIAILIGALLLMTPGFVTDLLGFLLLFPMSRDPFIEFMKSYVEKRIRKF